VKEANKDGSNRTEIKGALFQKISSPNKSSRTSKSKHGWKEATPMAYPRIEKVKKGNRHSGQKGSCKKKDAWKHPARETNIRMVFTIQASVF